MKSFRKVIKESEETREVVQEIANHVEDCLDIAYSAAYEEKINPHSPDGKPNPALSDFHTSLKKEVFITVQKFFDKNKIKPVIKHEQLVSLADSMARFVTMAALIGSQEMIKKSLK